MRNCWEGARRWRGWESRERERENGGERERERRQDESGLR